MVGREALNLRTWVRFLQPGPCACSLTVEWMSYKHLIGVRFLAGALGYSTSMLWTILIILAIVALVLFILGRR